MDIRFEFFFGPQEFGSCCNYVSISKSNEMAANSGRIWSRYIKHISGEDNCEYLYISILSKNCEIKCFYILLLTNDQQILKYCILYYIAVRMNINTPL